jgi:protein-disulfide isomerase
MTHGLKLTLSIAALAALCACSSLATQRSVEGPEIAARIGNRAITVKELEERWRASAPAEHHQTMQAIYDGRRAALEEMASALLIETAAQERGLKVEAFLETEIGRRITPVAGGDVLAFYEKNTSRMGGQSLDQVAPAISQYLNEQRRTSAREALIAELRKSGPDIRMLSEPPRFEVAVANTDPSTGSASAPVTIVEFSDYQCPFCQRLEPTMKRILDTYGDQVRLVWKDFPLTAIHPHAVAAAESAHCAGDQGRFWDYADRLFANQRALQPSDLKKYAADLGLDAAKFDRCLDGSKYSQRVQESLAEGARLGLNSTPTLFVNGRMLSGAQPFAAVAALVDDELARRARQ